MTARWNRKDSDRLRPEDVISLDDRRRFVEAAIPGRHPAKTYVTTILIVFVTIVVDVLCWNGFAHGAGAGKWAWFVFALLFLGLCLWSFGRLMLYWVRMFKRYYELWKLRK